MKRCFADRKDGTCHALTKKECENCKFYYPRTQIKENPFYEYSFNNEKRFEIYKAIRDIPDEYIMKKSD